MRNIIFIILLSLLMISCSKNYEVKVYNKCDNEITVTFDGKDTEISANNSKTFDAGTKVNYPLTNEEVKRKLIDIDGPTFEFVDGSGQPINNGVYIELKPEKTYKIYVNPNRAALKILNNSEVSITELKITWYVDGNVYRIFNLLEDGEEVLPNESFTYKVLPTTDEDNPNVYVCTVNGISLPGESPALDEVKIIEYNGE